MKKFLLIGLFYLTASFAVAHTGIETSEPSDGATLSEAPTQINMQFYRDIRLTRVNLLHASDAPMSLELGDQTDFRTDFIFPVEPMGAGNYQIEWRGLGADGHPMQGDFSFGVE